MKNYWILTRVMIRNMLVSMNPANGSYADGRKKKRALVRTAVLLLLALGSLSSIIFVEYEIFKVLSSVRQPILLPGLAIFLSMMLTLVMGLFQCLSELFQGKDAPFLAVLPLTSRQVFTARMTTLYLSELAVDAVICIPAFVLYGIGRGSAWPVALTGIPVLLLLPLIPLSIVALIASGLMRVSYFSRHRDTIVMIASMALAIAYSVGVTLMNSGNESFLTGAVRLVTADGVMSMVLNRFPPAMWAAKGLLGETGMLALFAAASAGCAAAVILLAGPGYLNQALSGTEKTVRGKRKAKGFSWNTGTPLRALHALEWKEILRTPAWASNSLMGVLMFPLMICIGFVSGFSKAGDGIEEIRRLVSTVDQGYTALVAAGVMMFGAMVNPAVSTAISREGGRWPFALTLPVRQKTRFMAKLMVGAEINLVCMILIAAVAWFMVRMPFLWLLAAFLVAGTVGLAAAALSLWVDATKPHLSWATEMEAIKKNFNQVIGMMLWVVMVALCVIPAVLLWGRGGGAALAGAAAVALAELAVSMILLNRVTEKHTVLPE